MPLFIRRSEDSFTLVCCVLFESVLALVFRPRQLTLEFQLYTKICAILHMAFKWASRRVACSKLSEGTTRHFGEQERVYNSNSRISLLLSIKPLARISLRARTSQRNLLCCCGSGTTRRSQQLQEQLCKDKSPVLRASQKPHQR